MSSVSQTPARGPPGLALGLGGLSAAALAAVALGPAAGIRLHGPDMAVWAQLSPAIKVHVIAALAALVLGAALMVLRKGRSFHRVAGWVWVALVSVTAGATLFITSLNHGSWSWLHLFTGWVLIVLPLAVVAVRRRAVRQHRRTMMGLFYGGFAVNLLIAFIPGRALWMMFFG